MLGMASTATRMLTWALADRLSGKPVTANALAPGYVVTELTRKRARAAQGRRCADPAGRCGHDHLAGCQSEGGRVWSNRREVLSQVRDPAAVEQLWTLVEQQVAST